MSQSELLRGLNERALQWARARQSEETGFLHLHYHLESEVAQSIPTYENFLFAYSLLRCRTVEAVLEAKALIDKLLFYQSRSREGGGGNFPIYLHEAPYCLDPLHPLKILPLCYYILSQFKAAIGDELFLRLSQCAKEMLAHCIALRQGRPLGAADALRLTSLQNAFALLFGEEFVGEEEGFSLIAGPSSEWFSPATLSEIILSLQLSRGSIQKSRLKSFWQYLSSSYDGERACYVGPCLKNYFSKERPTAPLYELYMALFSGEALEEILSRLPIDLTAALLQDFGDLFDKAPLPFREEGALSGCKWAMVREKEYSLSYFDHELDKLDSGWKGAIPFFLTWKEGGGALSLAVQGGNYRGLTCSTGGEEEPHSYRLDFDLSGDLDTDHKEQKKELIFSITKEPSLLLFVNGERSNTFHLGDRLQIASKGRTLQITFRLIEGEGRFFGHIMPGNRVSQLALKNGNRFNAYDWQIILRTLDREAPCRISATVELQGAL